MLSFALAELGFQDEAVLGRIRFTHREPGDDFSDFAVAAPRLTLVGELLGRRLNAVGRLVETTLPHPRLAGVDTVRLTSSDETAERLLVVAGFKWNIASTWLLTANILRPLTDVGLNARWVPSVTFDYWFD